MLSACSYVYEDKFTVCVQNVCLPNACMHRSECLLRTRPTFSETFVVSVGVSKLGCTEWFLSRVSILTRDIDIAILSVFLSVRPSVRDVPVSDKNGLTYRHSFFTRYAVMFARHKSTLCFFYVYLVLGLVSRLS